MPSSGDSAAAADEQTETVALLYCLPVALIPGSERKQKAGCQQDFRPRRIIEV